MPRRRNKITLKFYTIRKHFESWCKKDCKRRFPIGLSGSFSHGQGNLITSLCICQFLKNDQCPICEHFGGIGYYSDMDSFERSYSQIRKTEKSKGSKNNEKKSKNKAKVSEEIL